MNNSSIGASYIQQISLIPDQTPEMELNQKLVADDPVVILQPSGHVYYSNNAFLQLLNTPAHKVYTRHLFDFIHCEDAQPTLDIILALMSTSYSSTRKHDMRIKVDSETYIRKNALIKVVIQEAEVIGIKIKFSDHQ